MGFPSCSEQGHCGARPLAVASLVAEHGFSEKLWLTGLGASRHVGSSQTRDGTHVSWVGRRIPNPLDDCGSPCNCSFILRMGTCGLKFVLTTKIT